MTLVRVLHIVGRMDRAGAETLLMNLYREVDRSQFQFDFAYFTDERCDYDNEIEELGGRIVRIRGENSATRFLGLWRALRGGGWQIVHAHTLFSSGLHLLAAKLAGVPRRVAHSHSTNGASGHSVAGRIYQRGMHWLLSRVTTSYLACGNAAANYLFPGRHDVRIIRNAINIGQFIHDYGAACRQALGLVPVGLVILQVGRLMRVKNHALSVRIAAALQEAGVDFQMLFVGTGSEQPAIEVLIRQHGLDGRVRLLGMREDIPELMGVAHVMLMPSLHEGFPVVLVESQAAGLPAVISSAISSEVDLDLGLVNFVDLDAPPEEWAARIVTTARAGVASPEIRRQTLEAHGFSARAGAERLASIYLAP